MKSKTIKFNIAYFLVTVLLVLGYLQWIPGMPRWIFVLVAILGWVISQAITYFTPSGAFVGKGENWSVGKWIERIGLSVLAIFDLMISSGIGSIVAALLQPIIEIIIRRYGSETSRQIQAHADRR